MLRLTCPWCGSRAESEFRCGGESRLTRPGLDSPDDEWADYLFNRYNPKGLHFERWNHAFGCGQWFNVIRDTMTHDIKAVYRMDEAHPA